jgi:concanavalin A-like lectin/glucanase superfamily protein
VKREWLRVAAPAVVTGHFAAVSACGSTSPPGQPDASSSSEASSSSTSAGSSTSSSSSSSTSSSSSSELDAGNMDAEPDASDGSVDASDGSSSSSTSSSNSSSSELDAGDAGKDATTTEPDAGDAAQDATEPDGDATVPDVIEPDVVDASDGSDADAAADADTLTQGLVSWWRAEGNAADSVGPNTGTIQGGDGGVTFVPGKIGQAFSFNGTSGDVLIPTSTTLNLTASYTIAFWINIPALPSADDTILINKWVNGLEDKFTWINANGHIGFYLFEVTPVTSPLVSATALSLNTWHHVAATYNGADENIYIDGQFDASQVAAGDIANNTGSLCFAHNASRAAFNNTYFAGDLDEIRWYSRALSGAEVTELAAGDQ